MTAVGAQPDDVVAAIADALTYVPQIHMLRQTLRCSTEVTVGAAASASAAAAFGPTSQFLDINVCSPKENQKKTLRGRRLRLHFIAARVRRANRF